MCEYSRSEKDDSDLEIYLVRSNGKEHHINADYWRSDQFGLKFERDGNVIAWFTEFDWFKRLEKSDVVDAS